MTRSAHRSRSIWNLLILFIFGIGITIVLCEKEVVAGSTVNPSQEEISEGSNGTKKNYTLGNTGNPQVDYVNDPNLPRELNGYNLSSYPFFSKIPPNITFKCDGLKDGFYASVIHKCQLYHHCLFGTRYDFLCANYTAFDQRTFICTFVSDVDCDNSADYFHRNEALYKAATTTTQAPIYIGPRGRRIRPAVAQAFIERDKDYDYAPDPPPRRVTTPAPSEPPKNQVDTKTKGKETTAYEDEDYPLPLPPRRRNRRRCGPGRRRRCRRPRPRDYYDYDDYEDYYDTGRRGGGSRNKDREYEDDDYEEGEEDQPAKLKKKNRLKSKLDKTSTTTPSTTPAPAPTQPAAQSKQKSTYEVHEEPPLDPESLAANRDNLFTKSRAPPKIRPPVPIHEKRKYNNLQGREIDASSKHRSTSTTSTTTTTPPPAEYEYAEYDDYEQPSSTTVQSTRSRFVKHHSTTVRTTTSTTTTTTPAPSSPDPQYDYEYVEYETEPQVPETTTSTTKKPPRLFASRRHQMITSEPVPTEDTADESRHSNTALQSPTLSPGTTEHLKIIEALETPTNPSFRQPYQNRPRPSAVKNFPLVAPATTSTTTTTTTTESERKSDISFGTNYDGMNRRFPAFDTVSKSVVETAMIGAERERSHRTRQRNPARLQYSSTTTTESPSLEEAEYVDFQDHETEIQMPERYGQKSILMATPEYQQPQQQHDYSGTRTFVHPNHIRSTTLQPVQEISLVPSPAPQITNNFQHFYQNSYNPRLRETTPRVPSNFVSSYPTSAAPISVRPEFISLLSEDDDTSYYSQAQQQQHSSRPSQRFSVGNARVNTNRGLLSLAQQLFPTFTMPQISQFSSSLAPKSIRPRNIFQQLYSPFSYPGY